MQQCAFHAMGCQMLALVDTDTPAAAQALAQVPDWFAQWERQLSRFRDDSELMRLNRSTGRPVHVSRVLWEVIEAALVAAQQSDGLVTPTLLDALEVAGYDRSFETIVDQAAEARRVGSHDAAIADWRAIQRDERHRCVRLLDEVRLDLGGIAKGWAADRAAQRLNMDGPALVDAGGDIAVSARMAGGERWLIGVASPFAPDADLERLLLDRGGVATSGRDYRRWRRDGAWLHHILDPRTGRPAQTDVLSATIVAPSASEAEVAAKVALILGSRDGMAWIEDHPPLAGLLVLENEQVLRSRRLRDYLED